MVKLFLQKVPPPKEWIPQIIRCIDFDLNRLFDMTEQHSNGRTVDCVERWNSTVSQCQLGLWFQLIELRNPEFPDVCRTGNLNFDHIGDFSESFTVERCLGTVQRTFAQWRVPTIANILVAANCTSEESSSLSFVIPGVDDYLTAVASHPA